MLSPRQNDPARKAEQNARRQAAWRKRQAQERRENLAAKGLPAGPAISSFPGTTRWKAQHLLALNTLQDMAAQMQDYFDDRTQRWQESERGEAMTARLEMLDEVLAALQEFQVD